MSRSHLAQMCPSNAVVLLLAVLSSVVRTDPLPAGSSAAASGSFYGGGSSNKRSAHSQSALSAAGGNSNRVGGATGSGDPCYDDEGSPKRCQPDFVNAAFGRQVVASSTCGTPSVSKYCMTSRDRDGRVGRSCYVCDAAQPRRRHPASYLTDLNNPNNLTCWMSNLIGSGGGSGSGELSASNNVTLTLSFGKKFEVSW